MPDHPPPLAHSSPALPAIPRGRPARLPANLDAGRLLRCHGPLLGRLLLWTNRARVRHRLGRLAREAPDDRFADIGISRAQAAREAARRFWQEMDAP